MTLSHTFDSTGVDLHVRRNFDDITFNVLHFNWDYLIINSGIERSGKSSFGLDQAYYFSKKGLNFDWSPKLSNLFFFEENLSKKMMGLPNKSVAILDEGGENLLSRKAMEREVIQVVQTLMIYGAKNIVLIINMPDWRWLDKYVRESRVRALFDVVTYPRKRKDEEGNVFYSRERGFYRAYSRKKILEACKREPPALAKPSFNGRFKAFESVYPEAWAWYSDRKRLFLEEKSRKGRKPAEAVRLLPDNLRAQVEALRAEKARARASFGDKNV